MATKPALHLKVQHVPASTLKPYYRNTKHHSEEQLRKMAKMLDRFHFDQPIVVTPDMVIIKGHGRYMASLLSSNKTLLPIIVRDDMTPAQMKAARISDNRMFDMGEAIPELIESELATFVEQGGEGAEAFFDFMLAPVQLAAPTPAPNPDPEPAPTEPVGEAPITATEEPITLVDNPEDNVPQGDAAVPPTEGEQEQAPEEQAKPKKQKEQPPAEVTRCPNCNIVHEE